MPNSKIFCAVPWYEININNDGSYDLCGCQNDKILGTDLGQVHNIKKIPITEYWNGPRMREARLRKLGDEPDSMCRMCQSKDASGYTSTRVKENQKSVIFVDQFERSFAQSPNYHRFKYSQDNNGSTETTPLSLHVNLGDACNFACRMCNPWASTKLRQEMNTLGWIKPEWHFGHWTDDAQGWNNFLDFLHDSGSKIKVIHIIGGEVALIPKFSYLINWFIEHDLAHQVHLSFTINGSLDYSKFFDRLAQFKRLEIGISIESVGAMGDYIRQGGNIEQILKNIQYLNQHKPSNTSLTLRTVPSLLSLPDYADLIQWAFKQGIPIDASWLVNPPWQSGLLLPDDYKAEIIDQVQAVLSQLHSRAESQLNNQKDPNKIAVSIRNECESIINFARTPAPNNAKEMLTTCADRLDAWDKMKKINLKNYSKPLFELLSQYGYHGA